MVVPDLSGIKVAVLGGDKRQTVMLKSLAQQGAQVITVGLPVLKTNGVNSTDDPVTAVKDVDAVILPMQGINQKRKIITSFVEGYKIPVKDIIGVMPKDSLLFTGVARYGLKDMAYRQGIKVVELNAMDELAILNSIPTAEGAIQIAMENLPITIHGSSAFVFGFGRTGITLARVLDGMSANVFVVARNLAQLARSIEMGLKSISLSQLTEYVNKADVIFNTVPALVITKSILERLKKECLIIDIASAPGGTDFKSAEDLGIKAILAPGLPGKVAPVTSGKILARVISRLLEVEKGNCCR